MNDLLNTSYVYLGKAVVYDQQVVDFAESRKTTTKIAEDAQGQNEDVRYHTDGLGHSLSQSKHFFVIQRKEFYN